MGKYGLQHFYKKKPSFTSNEVGYGIGCLKDVFIYLSYLSTKSTLLQLFECKRENKEIFPSSRLEL